MTRNNTRINADENNVLNIQAEAKRLADLGYTKEDFENWSGLDAETKQYYSYEEVARLWEELPKRDPLEWLKETLEIMGEQGEWDDEFVDEFCRNNNLERYNIEWHSNDSADWPICHDDTRKLIENDYTGLEILPL